MTPMAYRWLADLVVALHAGFIAFVVLGQVLILVGWAAGWGWVRHFWFRAVHMLAILVVVIQSWAGLACPLTTLEGWLRLQAGEARYGGDVAGFIGYWAHELIFYDGPRWAFTLVYTMFAVVVVWCFIVAPPRRPGRAAQRGALSAAR